MQNNLCVNPGQPSHLFWNLKLLVLSSSDNLTNDESYLVCGSINNQRIGAKTLVCVFHRDKTLVVILLAGVTYFVREFPLYCYNLHFISQVEGRIKLQFLFAKEVFGQLLRRFSYNWVKVHLTFAVSERTCTYRWLICTHDCKCALRDANFKCESFVRTIKL